MDLKVELKETPEVIDARLRVAIQGVAASYHDIAAQKYFGTEIGLICCHSFTELFETLEGIGADYGIMAIENSVAGTILPNYAHLQESSYHIVGETYLRIEHQLMALPGHSIENLREVRSHPMALLQCKQFFKQHTYIEQIVEKDTALSAMDISTQKLAGVGVIASKAAAETFRIRDFKKQYRRQQTKLYSLFNLRQKRRIKSKE